MAAFTGRALLRPSMPSKGEAQARREPEARKTQARTGTRLAVREALDAGLSTEEIAQAFAEVLRERGLLATADEIITTARKARKT